MKNDIMNALSVIASALEESENHPEEEFDVWELVENRFGEKDEETPWTVGDVMMILRFALEFAGKTEDRRADAVIIAEVAKIAYNYEPTIEQEEEKENEPMTTTYNITRNTEFDSYEVTFESKPATAVLDALKALKMRWNPKKACWYGFAKESEILSAILNNGEGETITGEKTEGATVYTDGYLGGGAVYGSKSKLHLYDADLSKAIREDIKRAGIKGATVRCKRYSGGQSIGVTVALRPDEFVSLDEYIEKFEPGTCGDYGYIHTESGVHRVTDREFYEASAEEQQKIRRAAAEYEYEQLATKECNLNIYYLDDCNHLTPAAHAKIKKINEIICAYRYDESNSQVDYFHTNFYYDIYTKPAAVKPTTPDDEPTKPAKDEPKEEPSAEETAPVQPAEQAQEVESVVEAVDEAVEAPAVVYVVDNNGHDIVTRHIGGINYKVTFREDGKPLGIPETFTIDSITFIYGIDVTAPPVEPTETASEPQQPENALDIAYTANLRRVYENTLSRMANNEYYGSETENGIKMALEYLELMPEILTEDQINHAMRLAMCRRNSPDQPTPEAEPAETITESAGEIPEEVPETDGFHPIINNLPKESKWDVWNVQPDEYLSSCVVPLVRCDENYHVLDTVYLKVDTPEEVKTLMSAAAVGNRRRWPKYNKQYRRETVQRAADIIQKYYI